MDGRLVRTEARGRRAEGVLHPGEYARRPARGELRQLSAEHQDSTQGTQGRIASLRAQLLPPLSTRGPPSRASRHVDEPRWIPLHHAKSKDIMTSKSFKLRAP